MCACVASARLLPMRHLLMVPDCGQPVATDVSSVVNLSGCYRLNFQQPLLIKYAGDDHRQRGAMTAQKFLSYFPVEYGELPGGEKCCYLGQVFHGHVGGCELRDDVVPDHSCLLDEIFRHLSVERFRNLTTNVKDSLGAGNFDGL